MKMTVYTITARNVQGPEKLCRPRKYVSKGGGAAKYGVQYRWNLFKDVHPAHGTTSTNNEGSNDLDNATQKCNNCERIHHPRLAFRVEDLIQCSEACITRNDATPDRSLADKRDLVLARITKEIKLKDDLDIIPSSASNDIFPTLEWINQSKRGTKMVLFLIHQIRKKAEEHKTLVKRSTRVIQYGMPGSLAATIAIED